MVPIHIEIKQDMAGFSGFIGSWLCISRKNILIDVGPPCSAQHLLNALDSLGVERLDYILLTHIHIDHSGALPAILERYPMARALCHGTAMKHLLDPSLLWAASLSSLGPIAEGYGLPQPVSAEQLLPHTECGPPGLTVIETPGHAAHHLGFCYEGNLFPGEAGGIYVTSEDMDYMRPATPPRLYYDTFMASIERLLLFEDMPICYAHFSRGGNSRLLLKRFREQMLLWREVILNGTKKDVNGLEERCFENLIRKDDNLRALTCMEPATQMREKFFLLNSIKGFLDH